MFFLFTLSFLGALTVIAFIISKVPALVNLNGHATDVELSDPEDRLERKVKRELKNIFTDFLQAVLQIFRKFIIKTESVTTKWLYTIKRKKKERK